MSQRLDCALDGVWLQTLDSRIYTRDVVEEVPRVRITAVPSAVGEGERVTAAGRKSLSVTVLAEVRERNPAQRAEVLERMAAWAAGHTLTCTQRPGRLLRVRCVEYPCGGSAVDWAAPVRIRLTAHEVPWWQDLEPTTLTMEDMEAASELMLLPGYAAETPVSCTVTNRGTGVLTDLTVSAGSTRITLTGLNVPSGRTVNLSHDLDGRLRITAGGASAMVNRTPESDDDLIVPCGLWRAVSAAANVPVTVVFSGRGRYL